jgi:hypothetical protein
MLKMTRAIAIGAMVLALLIAGCGGGSQETASSTQTEAGTQTESGGLLGSPTQTEPNAPLPPAEAVAAIEKGPFTQSLEQGLRAKELRSIKITGSSAAGLVGAVELVVDTRKAPPHTAVSAHIELYSRPREAVARGRARIALLERKGAKVVGGVNSFCGPATLDGQKAWECGGIYGRAYAEAIVTPRGSAPPPEEMPRSLAVTTMSALLDYAQEKGA